VKRETFLLPGTDDEAGILDKLQRTSPAFSVRAEVSAGLVPAAGIHVLKDNLQDLLVPRRWHKRKSVAPA